MPEARPPRRAAFLDRDGTICEEMAMSTTWIACGFSRSLPRRSAKLNEAQVPVIVVTNQSGVARDISRSRSCTRYTRRDSELSAGGARVDAIYFCPPQDGECLRSRKPNPGLLERAAREHALDLPTSWLSVTAMRTSKWGTPPEAAESW